MHPRHAARLIPFLFAVLLASAPVRASSQPSNPYADALVHQALERKLDESHYWKILLHFRPRWFGGVKSEVDARAFFNAPDGRVNARSELEGTLRAFFESPRAADPKDPSTQHPQCRFIDRYRWLRAQLAFDPARLPEVPCPEFEEWRAALAPESVTLVFSSYYMNNPASVFGHTLLRLNHRGRSRDEHLLDYGVNYAANPWTDNALLYGVLGITGGFPGVFSNIPYYVKVDEYNDAESRDLWEYDLKLGQDQIDRMMAHLWVIGHVQISYYFLDRNCSYMVLALLDSADPDLRLADAFQGPIVIPADTVRGLSRKPGLVTEVRARPAIATRIQRQRALMTPAQESVFLKLVGSRPGEARSALAEAVKQPEPAVVIDAVLDYLRYLKTKKKGVLSGEEASLQSELLLARSEIEAQPRDVSFSAGETQRMRPDVGHDTARASVGYGYDGQSGSFAEIGARAAFHDMNAQALGYPSYSEIEIGSVALRYHPDARRFSLEKLSLMRVLSLSPMDRLFPKLSWDLQFGWNTVRDFDCGECHEFGFKVGGGASALIGGRLLVYGLLQGYLGIGADSVPGYRLGPGATVGTLLELSDAVSVHAWGDYVKPVMGFRPDYLQASAEARVSTGRNSDLRAGFDAFETTSQGRLLLNVYF